MKLVTQGALMKLEALIDPTFKVGLSKLISSGLPMKVSFKLEGIVTAVEAELKKFEATRMAALKKYGIVKEDGEFEVDELKNVVFKSEEDAKAFAKEYAELIATEVEIETVKLSDVIDRVENITVDEIRKLKASILEL